MAKTSIEKSTVSISDTQSVYSTIGFRRAVYSELLNYVHVFQSRERNISKAKLVNLALALLFAKLKNASVSELDKLVKQMNAGEK